jgi:putative hydrolase of the HAD superfamily
MHGYGSRVFAQSLRETYIQVMSASEDDPQLPEVERFGLRILDQLMEPIPGVTETLAALRPHHDLLLLTKGNRDEQRAKIDRSNIAHLFDAALVVSEKHPDTYRDLVNERELDRARTWMIGNSPRSDINPALQAHINAVFIPHPLTWQLEVEEISHIRHHHPGELIELSTFTELQDVFLPHPQTL